MSTTQELVAQAIRVQRIRAGFPSEAELARTVGMAPSALSKRLAGDIRMDLEEVERIAAALGITAFDLMDAARAEALAA